MSDPRCVMISGANRGIGAVLAKRLFDAGWCLSLGMRSPAMPDWADAARVQVCAYDATDPASAQVWADAVMARFGRIDAVVANAGIANPQDVVNISDDEMNALLQVNVMGPQRLAKAAWDGLKVSGQGRVILLGSLSGKRVKSARSGPYSVSKFAAVGLAHALRHAGFDEGIRATAVCPGFVATDMAQSLTDRDTATMTQPEDLAQVIEMLINLPNTASVAEFHVNCQLEESF
ncbi:SDR family NAD(P)-dependent oxidoreductase [Thioclava sp. GXIMD2076]|uniref:SDR family NAD(P)-dependent oxidoreductase n=1 Tax=Thioclava sp. GXIMD2076 TaxID=3131931 RepID=UPI0030D54594